jgi:glycosyltransferase involved in cell wall biosynthesis
MWDLTLSPRLAWFGRAVEERLAPPFYRRSRILTPSETSKQDIVRMMGLPASNITTVAPGVDPMFTPGGTRDVRPTILAVGRLVPYKGFHHLISLMPEIKRRVPGARLLIVGDGHRRSALQQLVDDLRLGDDVRLLGRVSEVELVDLYRSSWVLTSGSISEGWGLTITEAAACGTPSVVTRIGGHSDAVTDGHTGLLADTHDELQEGLVTVLSHPALRDRLGSQALASSNERTWSTTALQIFDAIAASADERGRRRVRRRPQAETA